MRNFPTVSIPLCAEPRRVVLVLRHLETRQKGSDCVLEIW
jgi:hypothetical protein